VSLPPSFVEAIFLNQLAMKETGYINRSRVQIPFCQVPNKLLQDRTVSLRAKGLLAYLLSLPPDWKIYKSNLHNFLQEGRDSVNNAWQELSELGYIVSERITAADGTFVGWEHNVFIEPQNQNCEEISVSDIEDTSADSQEGNRLTENPNTDGSVGIKRIYSPKNINISKKEKEKKEIQFSPPTEQELILYFKSNGFSEKAAREAFAYYTRMDWSDRNGSRIKNWKLKMKGVWFTDKNKDIPQVEYGSSVVQAGGLVFRRRIDQL